MTQHPINTLSRDLDEILARTEPLWQELRGQRILITGATGFFGCWLLESFAWANKRLNLKAQAVGIARHPRVLAEKASHLSQDASIVMHAADVRSGNFPNGNFSHCIHAATEASAKLNREAPQLMFDTIVEGTRRTLKFAREHSVSRFLLVSSGAVYGKQPSHIAHVRETFDGSPDPLDPASSYAEGKRAAEMLTALAANSAAALASHSGAAPSFSATVARCFAFVGPYMQLNAHFAIGNFIEDGMNERCLAVTGDGTAVRSYLYASDLMVWLWTVLFKGESGRAYNVGSEREIAIGDLARTVASSLPHDPGYKIALKPTAGAPVQRYVPSTERARTELGLSESVPLREAVHRTYSWFSSASARVSSGSQPVLLSRDAHV